MRMGQPPPPPRPKRATPRGPVTSAPVTWPRPQRQIVTIAAVVGLVLLVGVAAILISAGRGAEGQLGPSPGPTIPGPSPDGTESECAGTLPGEQVTLSGLTVGVPPPWKLTPGALETAVVAGIDELETLASISVDSVPSTDADRLLQVLIEAKQNRQFGPPAPLEFQAGALEEVRVAFFSVVPDPQAIRPVSGLLLAATRNDGLALSVDVAYPVADLPEIQAAQAEARQQLAIRVLVTFACSGLSS